MPQVAVLLVLDLQVYNPNWQGQALLGTKPPRTFQISSGSHKTDTGLLWAMHDSTTDGLLYACVRLCTHALPCLLQQAGMQLCVLQDFTQHACMYVCMCRYCTTTAMGHMLSLPAPAPWPVCALLLR